MMDFIALLKGFAWFVSFILACYAFYFSAFAILSALPQKHRPVAAPRRRLAFVVAARNEEAVIGNLIDTMKRQDYPTELYDIYVVLNNCTDQTEEVARRKGAKIYRCEGRIRSKGDALREFFDHMEERQYPYDGFCVVDADNLVDQGFLRAMNSALCDGAKIAQGYRDSKNPGDTYMSGCYSIYYYMVNRFHNRTRSRLNLSAMINGSGFVVSAEVLKQQGGWITRTVTEDIEFTMKCVLAGIKVAYVPEAIVYDEQPQTFQQSWTQRKRWSTGLIQAFEMYSPKLALYGIRERCLSAFDLMMFAIAPVMQIIYLISIILTIGLTALYAGYDYFPQTDLFYKLFLSVDVSYITSLMLALIVTVGERKPIASHARGIMAYWFFIFSWMPINIICLWRKQIEWVPIQHTRVLALGDLRPGKN